MSVDIKEYVPGFTFTMHIPMRPEETTPYYAAKCVIVAHTYEEIQTFVTVGDWMKTTFSIPKPHHNRTIMNSIYLSLCEMVPKAMEEYLCTL